MCKHNRKGMLKLVLLTRTVQDPARICGIHKSAEITSPVQFALTGSYHRATSSRRLLGGGFSDAWRETWANRPPNIPPPAALWYCPSVRHPARHALAPNHESTNKSTRWVPLDSVGLCDPCFPGGGGIAATRRRKFQVGRTPSASIWAKPVEGRFNTHPGWIPNV